MGLKRANNKNKNPTPQPGAFATKARRATPLRGAAPVVLGAPPSGKGPRLQQQPTVNNNIYWAALAALSNQHYYYYYYYY